MLRVQMVNLLWVSTLDVAEVDLRKTQICILWTWHKISRDPKELVWLILQPSCFTQLQTKQVVLPKLLQDSNRFTLKSILKNLLNKKTRLLLKRQMRTAEIKKTVSLRRKGKLITLKRKTRKTETTSHRRKSEVESQNLFMRIKQKLKKSSKIK